MADIADLAYFSADGHGSRFTFVEGFSRGVQVQGSVSHTRNHVTFYPKKVMSSQFTVDVAFSSTEGRNIFNRWMQEYTYKRSNGNVGQMLVEIPARQFVAYGIPLNDLDFGHAAPESAAKRVTYKFETVIATDRVKDPVHIPANDVVKHFYPTGVQLSGALFDSKLYNEGEAVYDAQDTTFSQSAFARWYELNNGNPNGQLIPGPEGTG